MVETVEGIFIILRLLQPLKTSPAIFDTFGKENSVRLVQLLYLLLVDYQCYTL